MLAHPLRRLLGRSTIVHSYFHTSASHWVSRKVLHKFNLADIGEGITECEVIKWSVKPASIVQAFDPLCEVQSDKASVEITSPLDGVVKEFLVQEGEIAKVGTGLCIIEVEEDVPETDISPAAEPSISSAPHLVPSENPASETKDSDAHTLKRRLHPLDPNYAAPDHIGKEKDVLAAPSVRYFARGYGVDLEQLAPGSGKGGRIEKRDVEMHLERLGTHGGSSAGQTSEQKQGSSDIVVELGRTRYSMWKAMVKSLEIPHFGYSTTLDLTELHNLLPILNAHIPPHFLPPTSIPRTPQMVNQSSIYTAPCPSSPIPESQQYTKLTYLPILLKTLSKAMLQWPLLRSSITVTPNTPPESKPTLTIRPHTDISIALSTPTGLYTPTIQSVDAQSIYSISAQLKHMGTLGRQQPSGLTVKEMPKRGGTITVSNVGAVGKGEWASPVLVPGGGVAIVAIGRAKWVWDVDDEYWDDGTGADQKYGTGRRGRGGNSMGMGMGKGERRLKVGISWSADHRVVEGAELAAFVECWRGYVEQPQRLIGEGV